MGDMGDYYNSIKADRKERRRKYGIECPVCKQKRPKTNASILLPGQRCKVDGYRDERPRVEGRP